MNHMTLMGHLGADPEVRFTSGGQKVTTIRLAVNQRKGGQDETLWWRITVWGEQFDKMIQYLKKGSALIAHGEMLKPEIYNNKEGVPQISLNFVAQNLSFPPFGRGDKQDSESHQSIATQAEPSHGQMQQGQGPAVSTGQPSAGFSEDEIPF